MPSMRINAYIITYGNSVHYLHQQTKESLLSLAPIEAKPSQCMLGLHQTGRELS
jgi:hypothetical protein